jgi:DNA repair ATPase RecN
VVETRVDRLEAALERLAEAQVRAEERLAGVEDRLERAETRLAGVEDRLARVEARVERVENRLQRVEDRLARTETVLAQVAEELKGVVQGLTLLTARVGQQDDKIGQLQGMQLEMRYQNRAPAYFARLLRGLRPLRSQDVATLAEQAQQRGVLTEVERIDLLAADVVVQGRTPDDDAPAYLVAEVSLVIDTHDVERALQRAGILGRATGVRVLPTVAGERILDAAADLAHARAVRIVLNGKTPAP